MIPAIIAARGGSIRIPRKNIKPFCGKSLVEWSIIQAKCSHLITDVYLSTDDEEIAEVGKKHGIEIIWRTGIAVGDITVSPVYIQAIEEIRKSGGEFDGFACILPTTICRHPDDFDRTLAAYERMKGEIDEANIRYCPKETIVFEKVSWRKDGDYCFPALNNSHHRYLIGNTCCQIINADHYVKMNKGDVVTDARITLRYEMYGWDYPTFCIRGYVEGKWYQQFDIDNQDDWELSEYLFERYILQGKGAQVYYDYRDGK